MYATAPTLGRVRRVRRKARRRTTFAALILVLGLLWPLAAYVGASSGARPEPVLVTVRAGDTLWDLAQRYGAPGRDLRETIFEIKRANGLRTSMLHPGQVLVIPER